MSADRPRGGLGVASLLVILLVPLVVGWCMERAAYGEARATENLLAPLGVTTPVQKPAPRQPWSAKPETPMFVGAPVAPEHATTH